MKKIIFVCHGNICRSVAAEYIMKSLTNNYVIVSKSNNPVIHFVIKHEKLMNAIINFYPIVKE